MVEGGAFTGATEAQADARRGTRAAAAAERQRLFPLSQGDMRGRKHVSPV